MKRRTPWRKCLFTKQAADFPASFTIEAAVIVPLVLAVVFLLLQTLLFLHDTVQAEAWLYHETWKQRWNEEGGTEVFVPSEAPAMAVLRYEEEQESRRSHMMRREVSFHVELLPEFVTVLFTGQPVRTEKRSTENKTDPWQFVRIAGAVLEEWEEGK